MKHFFYQLSHWCRSKSPKHEFRFSHKLFSLDSTQVDLSIQAFPWAQYAQSKGGVKVHVGLDHDGNLPTFASISKGCENDLVWGRKVSFPKGSMVVFDRAYVDYNWYQSLDDQGVFFVTRLKKSSACLNRKEHTPPKGKGIRCDEIMELAKPGNPKESLGPFRLVTVQDPETNKVFRFLTNHFGLPAKTIADVYKKRWQIEIFFKWIKQNLKIKSFMGISPNAVKTQIWIALCVNLLLHYLKSLAKTGITLQQVLRLLQLNLFIKRDLIQLLQGMDPGIIPKNLTIQKRLL